MITLGVIYAVGFIVILIYCVKEIKSIPEFFIVLALSFLWPLVITIVTYHWLMDKLGR